MKLSRDEHERRLRLYHEDKRDREIAEVVGVSGAAICSWRKKHGLPAHQHKRFKLTAEEEAERMKLYLEGLSDREIGEKLYLERSTVLGWRRSRGLPANYGRGEGPGIDKRDHKRRLEFYKRGLNDKEIAAKLGLHFNTIRRWRYRNDLPANDKGGLRRHLDFMSEKKRMALYRLGMSDRKIGRKLGISHTAVREWRERRGLEPNCRQYNKGNDAKYNDLDRMAEILLDTDFLKTWKG